mgnify:CR=1 FL=1
MKRSTLADRECAIAKSSAELVDAWSFMILRELFLGNHRFDGILRQTGMSPRSLTLRLAHLLEAGVLEKREYQQTPQRFDYRLSQKGIELWPVLIALKQWGDKWHGPWGEDGPPVQLMHKGLGHALSVRMVCDECGKPVDAHASEVTCSRAFAAERRQRQER